MGGRNPILQGSNGGSKWGTQSQYLTPKKFFPVFGLWRPGLFELRDGTYTIGKLRVSAFQCSHFLASEVVWRPIFRDFFLQFLTFFCHLIKLSAHLTLAASEAVSSEVTLRGI